MILELLSDSSRLKDMAAAAAAFPARGAADRIAEVLKEYT
jgi:UDP-N-acetylglucosamine:LPS N-acetylglucosamine transferase